MDRNSSTERTPLTSLSSLSSATSRTREKAAVGTAGTIDVTLHASSSGSRSGPPATAATTTGPDRPRRRRPKADLRRSRRTRVPGVRPASQWRSGTQAEHGTNLLPLYLRVVWLVCQRGLSRGASRAAGECDGAAAGGRWPQARRPAGLDVRTAAAPSPATSTNGPATPSRRTRHSRRKLTPRQAASALCGAEGGS